MGGGTAQGMVKLRGSLPVFCFGDMCTHALEVNDGGLCWSQ